MLLLFSQFTLKYSIKSQIYLLNPPIHTTDTIAFPRFTVIHYLDTKSNIHFPNKDLYYFKDIPDNKKIPVYSLDDLNHKDEVSVIENKYAQQEIRKWIQSNIRQFKNINLLEIPNSDTNMLSVINYNILKDLYRYKTSVLANHYRYVNLYKTYWETVKQALNADKESNHLVTIDIPNNIPNFNILDLILKFNTVKFSRIVSDEDLLKVIDLHRWLLNSTREKSTMSSITDNDCNRIIVEFRYKGYMTYLPLNILRGLSDESSIESTTKYKADKVKKLFILMLRRFQDSVNSSIENNTIPEDLTDVDPEEIEKQALKEELQDVDIKEGDDTDTLDSLPSNLSNFNKQTKLEKIKKLDDISNAIETDDFQSLIDNAIVKFEEEDAYTDKIYKETINKVLKEEDSVEDSFTVNYSDENKINLLKQKDLNTKIDNHIKDAVEFKTLTTTEIRNLKKLKEQRTLLKSPYETNTNLDSFKILDKSKKELPEEKIKLEINNNLIEDNLKKDILANFDEVYLNDMLKKDIISCVSNIEKSGIIIKSYEIEENRTSTGAYELHKLSIKHINGKDSTIYFRLPIIDSEGVFMSGNIKYKMRKTKQPLPIVKVSPVKVALTSNYNKLFLSRTERKAYSEYDYILNYIRKSYLEEEGTIKKIIPGNKTLNNEKLPNIYTLLASSFNEVKTDDLTLILNYNERAHYLDEKILKDIESKNLVFCGHLNNNEILVTDFTNTFYNYSANMSPIGDIVDILNIDRDKLPKTFSTMKVLGDDIPLGIILSYYLGLSGLISVTNTQYQLLESNKQYKPNKNELVLKFTDYKLILQTDTVEKKLLFNGYHFYKDFIKQHSVKDFDYKEIYLNLLETRDSGLIHIKEFDLLLDLFLDPITIDVLESMKEPTEFLPLLLRANELLKDLSHPDINDPNFTRIRGYDRVPGLMYRALAESIREHKLKGRSGKVELDPYKVWNYITQDSTVKITEDINPILNVRENEIVTLSGLDGLNKDATPKALRRYHKNEIGLTSEATVDSSDVALNIYLSPYAKIKDARGLIKDNKDETNENPGKVFSTSAMMSPMAEFEDIKRINCM